MSLPAAPRRSTGLTSDHAFLPPVPEWEPKCTLVTMMNKGQVQGARTHPTLSAQIVNFSFPSFFPGFHGVLESWNKAQAGLLGLQRIVAFSSRVSEDGWESGSPQSHGPPPIQRGHTECWLVLTGVYIKPWWIRTVAHLDPLKSDSR